jgi:hypothetical protein
MAIRYFPLTRVSTNKYTRGDEFILLNGQPYSGRYYTLFNGQSFAGVNPVLGSNERLYPVSSFFGRTEIGGSTEANARTLRNLTLVQQYTGLQLPAEEVAEGLPVLTELLPYYPAPLESDYERGYFRRYFAKKLTGPGYIFEISKTDWTKIQNGEIEETALGYETADILWQLTGPLNDKRISQYQVQGGVLTTNKRVVEGENKTFRGLIEFIGGDYTKFARITPE